MALTTRSAGAGRRYRVPVDVVLQVRDDLMPGIPGDGGCQGDSSGADCTPASADFDLTIDIRDLGAAYLGGTSLTVLAAARRVHEHRRGTLTAASTAFGWHQPPSTVEMF